MPFVTESSACPIVLAGIISLPNSKIKVTCNRHLVILYYIVIV